MAKKPCVYVMGKLPPPVGGVTRSIENWRDAFASINTECVFWPKSLGVKRYDFCQVHAYHSYKRFLSLLIGKILAQRVTFTIHGMHFDEADLWNRLSLWLSDGVFVLNKQVLESSTKLNNANWFHTTAVLKEGLSAQQASTERILPESDKPYALLYAQHSDSFDGEPIYGVPFIMECLAELSEQYKLVFIDATDSYARLEVDLAERMLRIDHPVDFARLLSEVAIYLRPTCKDGDSVAVQEALMAGVPVLASDVVARPAGVQTYKFNDQQDFINKLKALPTTVSESPEVSLTSVHDIAAFMESLRQ